MRVVGYLMHIHAQHVGGAPSQHGRSSAIDKDAPAIHVYAEYALTSRIQQQVELMLPQGACTLYGWER
jgi:glucosamine 6-phosphate synthetase-like amidotransferase/phosphosugar isomerase protein